MLIITLGLVIVHEGIHYITAYCLGLSPKVKLSLRSPSVTYKNKGCDIKNLLVSGIAPIILIIAGIFINGKDIISFYTKILCLSNVFNLLPFTTDGEVIVMSILNIVRKK